MSYLKKVSIIMPSYKEAKYIKKSIESIISQTFLNWELIIIDDGLYDEPKNEINSYIKNDKRIILLKNKQNLGIQKSLNIGLKEAKGEYIARIDDDDEWIDKDKLRKQVEFLDENMDYALMGTGVIYRDESMKEVNRSLFFKDDNLIRKNILSKCCFVHSTVLFRKDIVLDLGGYSESDRIKHSEDYELWLRLCFRNKSYVLQNYSVVYTIRDNSISYKNRDKRFKNDLYLIWKYRHNYPNYFKGLIFSLIRVILYGYIIKKPIRFYINKIKNYVK